MSGRADRLRLPRALTRRARPARDLDVDGRPSDFERIYGLGSVFGKSLRDARRGILVAGLGLGLLAFLTAFQVAAEFGTPAARLAMAALPNQLPAIFRGLLGEPINVERLGGFLSWRTLNFVPILLGAWSIASLSSTLAAEARRGSLDVVLATPRSRLSVALQKAGAHLVSVAVAAVLIGVLTWAGTVVFATLPGDETALADGLTHATWLWVMAIVPGSVAWAASPVVGRGAAAGLGALVMVVSFVAHGYREGVPAFETIDRASYFGLTAAHRPLAGATDWPSLALPTLAAATLLLTGAALFRSRDVGTAVRVGLPLPRLRLGLGGPFGRSFAERLSVATWWGIGLGAMGFVYAVNAESFIAAMRSIPQIEQMVARFFPGVDVFTPAGVLQLVFFGFGTLLVAAAVGMLVAGWASDETERRLELVAAAPVSRLRWGLSSGLGVLAAIAVLTAAVAALVSAGTALVGGDVVSPAQGSVVLGLYGMALAGVGLAAGGAVRPTLAAPVAAGLGVTFYLLDTLGAALQLPDEVLDLSLTAHVGQPMAGVFDAVGTATCAVLAVGGLVVAAVGLRRRDLGR